MILALLGGCLTQDVENISVPNNRETAVSCSTLETCRDCEILVDWSSITEDDDGNSLVSTDMERLEILGLSVDAGLACNANLSGIDVESQFRVDLSQEDSFIVDADTWSNLTASGSALLLLYTASNPSPSVSRVIEPTDNGSEIIEIIEPPVETAIE